MPFHISGEGVQYMYDSKVQQIANVIAPHVLFDNVDQAKEFVDSYRLPESAPVPCQIRNMAENFITYSDRFKLTELLDDRRCHPRTTISTVKEAIVEVAKRYVQKYENEELMQLPASVRAGGRVFA